jgi:aspartate aminotransferase-like enzyme
MTTTQPTSAEIPLPTAPAATNLRLPGPTPVPPEVAAAGSWPMVNHRGAEFSEIVQRITGRLRYFFQTSGDVICFPGSGSAGWDASITNLFSPGDRVAVITIGNFGDRFAAAANAYGLSVETIAFPWGQAADPAAVTDRLRALGDLKGVLFTHNETSTGVTNDLPALSRALHDVMPSALLVVDAVSSLGCIDLPLDDLGLDVVFTASQKGWMCPPGLMMISVGPRAKEATQTAKLPRFYWDFTRALASFSKNAPPYTVPVSLWYQLDVALAMMLREGREQIYARHAAIAAYTRRRLSAMGLRLFADPAHASNTVTAALTPEGMDAKALLKAIQQDDGVVFQGGQGQLEGKAIRVGHMGHVTEADVAAALDALARHL